MSNHVFGLCESRHPLPPEVTRYIFPAAVSLDPNALYKTAREVLAPVLKPSVYAALGTPPDVYADQTDVAFYYNDDTVTIYVTGFTPALIAAINVCHDYFVRVRLMHFNRDTNKYVEQWS